MEKIIETIVTATTELKGDNFANMRMVLCYDGHSTNVSSGSMFGSCQGLNIPDEDSVDVLKRLVQEHNEWLDSMEDENGQVHKLGLKFKNKVTFNGKEIIVDESNSLAAWIS